MAVLGNLIIKIIADTKELREGISDARSSLDGLKKTGDQLSGMGKKLTAGVTLPILGIGAASISAASNLEESLNAVNTVFEEGAGPILAYGEKSAEAVGLAQSEFSQLAAVAGSLLQNLGFDAAGAADETINLAERASDMASVFNTDVSQAMGAIQSALKGEFNPLEQFGVKMNQASINAKAMELGLVEVTHNLADINEANLNAAAAQANYNEMVAKYGAHADETVRAQIALERALEKQEQAMEGNLGPISDNAKAQAALALLYEQTDRIAGDFANTSDGLANSTRIAKAQLTDAAAALGQHLIPFALQAVEFIKQLVERFMNLSPEAQRFIVIGAGIAAALGPVLIIVGSLISAISAVIPVATAVAGVLSGPVLLAVGAVIGIVALLVAAWKNNWGGIRETVAKVWNDFLRPAFEALRAWLGENIPKAIETLRSFWSGVLLPALQSAWAFIQDHVVPILQTLGEITGTALGLAFTALAGVWENILKPALTALWDWVSAKIIPKLTWLMDKVVRPLGTALRTGLASALDWVNEKLGIFSDWLSDLSLPSWLTPGSPTPFELGLKGINSELHSVASNANRIFGGLTPAAAGVGAVGSLGVGGAGAFAAPPRSERLGGGAGDQEFKRLLRNLPGEVAEAVRDALLTRPRG